MKEDIKNIQSLQVNLEGEDFVFNRFGNMFVFNEDNKVETIDGSFSSNRNIQLSEDAMKNLDYTVLTYTEEYKQKLEDEYEATLQNKLDTKLPKYAGVVKVRKPKQIFNKLEEYRKELEYAQFNYPTVEDKELVAEKITVLSNMIKLLEWVLKIK